MGGLLRIDATCQMCLSLLRCDDVHSWALDVFHNIFFVAAAKFEIFKPVHVTDAMSRFHDVFYQGNAGEYGGR